jgi:hypothetical protein
LKLADLGVTKSHSRPYVSDDNPFSESQFKTLKYRPEFPDRFGSLEDARAHGQGFFHWYNFEHHHSGIAMLTPHMVHYGLAAEVLDNRQRVLTAAFQQHPERFVRKPPRPAPLPDALWINPSKPGSPEGSENHESTRAGVSKLLTSSACSCATLLCPAPAEAPPLTTALQGASLRAPGGSPARARSHPNLESSKDPAQPPQEK